MQGTTACGIVATVLAVFAAAGGALAEDDAAQQTIPLAAGWNLVGIQVMPEDPSPAAVFGSLGEDFVAAWTWKRATSTWAAWRRPGSEDAVLNEFDAPTSVPVGSAWWIYMNGEAVLVLHGANPPAMSLDLYAGWNLVGFPAGGDAYSEPIDLVALLEHAGADYDAILRWETSRYARYTTNEDDVDDFTVLDPDKGYWVRLRPGAEHVTIDPGLSANVRPDIDLEPKGNFPSYEDFQVSFAETKVSGGLRAPRLQRVRASSDPLGPEAQTHIAFFPGEDQQPLSIANSGGGVLLWNLTWEPLDRPDTEWVGLSRDHGVTTIESDAVTVYLDRTYLVQGVYKGRLTLRTNAGDRAWTVVANVGPLQGEWKGQASIGTVNYRANPVPDIDLHLDFFEDPNEPGLVRGLLDSTNSLLWPVDVPLLGHIPTDDRNAFVISGSYILPPGDVNNPPYATPLFPSTEDINWLRDSTLDAVNPFPFPIQRSLVLMGELAGGASQLGFSIVGAYTESVHGILREPIELRGTFRLQRVSKTPFTNRKVTANVESPFGQQPVVIRGASPNLEIGMETIERTLSVSTDMILQDIRVTIDITHPDPGRLTVSLVSPDGVEVVLHDRTAISSLQSTTFPDTRPPLEPLEAFLAGATRGDWTLRVTNHSAMDRATLNRWQLHLQGQPVFDLHGRVVDAFSGAGLPASVFLNGQATSLNTSADAEGYFVFRRVPGIPYNLTASHPGYEPLDSALPGLGNRAPVFEDNPSTDADEAALSSSFRDLPGLPLPAAATVGFDPELGTVEHPIELALNRRYASDASFELVVDPVVVSGPTEVSARILGTRYAVMLSQKTDWTWILDDGLSTKPLWTTTTLPSDRTTTFSLTEPGGYRLRVWAVFESGFAPGTIIRMNVDLSRNITVQPLAGETGNEYYVFQPFFTGGGAVPDPMPPAGVEPLLMTQHVDSANFDIDRAPFTTDADRDFDNDGLSGSGPDSAGIFKGEDTDYYNPAAQGMPEDPCENLRAGDGLHAPYPPPGVTDPACSEPRFRMTCNLLPAILPAAHDHVVQAPEMPGTVAPEPADPASADGIAKARTFRMVVGPMARLWTPGGND